MIFENLNFEKYHGLGNDYIIIDNLKGNISEEYLDKLAIHLCKLHYSVGADGLLLVCGSNEYDIKMRIFNNDGSEAEMCGNGVRCFSKFIYENNILRKEKLNIETLKGIIEANLNVKDGNVSSVKIDMGAPILECDEIPVILKSIHSQCVNESIIVLDKVFKFTAISMGNPHAIIFNENVPDDNQLIKYGGEIQTNKMFPKSTNVEFVKVLSDQEGILRVFERGVGITNSCGTGSCAAVVAGVNLGIFKKNHPILVHNDGGDLKITYNGNHVYMEGPAVKVFSGVIEKLEL